MLHASLLAVLLLGTAPQQSATPRADRLKWVPNPTLTTHGWVSDPAHHLSPETVRRIDSTIFALERTTSDEMAVVVIDSLDGLEPSDAALLLHRRWGVGKRDRNNGIVFLWSPALRKVYVSVGYRLEGVLPDARVGHIEDEAILPRFRAGDFDGGVLAGVIALAATAAGDTSFVNSRSAPAYHPPVPAAGVSSAPNASRRPRQPFWLISIFLTLGAAAVALVVWRAKRPPRCPNGHGPMQRLSQDAEGAKLSREERLEEELKSVNYDVWVCAQCSESIVIPHNTWFTSYRRCDHCGRRTSLATSKTLIPATQLNEGLVEVTTDCRNCGAHDVARHVTPRLPTPSSSSSDSGFSSSGSSGGSSGGSSFGGGSAGGGGAGRSY
jgi:uncharacterized protein